jgi:hypothetical protein
MSTHKRKGGVRRRRNASRVRVGYWLKRAEALGYPIMLVHKCQHCAPKDPKEYRVNDAQLLRDILVTCPVSNIRLRKPDAA